MSEAGGVKTKAAGSVAAGVEGALSSMRMTSGG